MRFFCNGKKKMGRIRFHWEGTKVGERVQSRTEQLFLPEWWLYYQGDLLKWSLLLFHWMRWPINSTWACQGLSPYAMFNYSACICMLVSASQPMHTSPSMVRVPVGSGPIKSTGSAMLCVPRNGEFPFPPRVCVCMFPARHVLECDRIKCDKTTCSGSPSGGGWEGGRIWLHQYQACGTLTSWC